ncbi:tash protein pest motif family [Burkholderia pseudomallei]|nr:tash protein pest motif family [Burkholderia pseudomallei]
MPVDVEVDSDVIALLADDSPVDADVDNDATLLLVVLNPVDSEPMPVDVEVDSDVIALFCWPTTVPSTPTSTAMSVAHS